jgi:AraC-like DNA-binding protein
MTKRNLIEPNTAASLSAPDIAKISTAFLDRIISGAEIIGANRADMLRYIGIRESYLRHPLGQVSGQSAMQLISKLEEQFDDPSIGMKIAAKSGVPNFSDPSYALRFLPNLGETIEAIVAAQRVRQNLAEVTYVPYPKPPVLSWQMLTQDSKTHAQFVEFSIAAYLRLSRDVLNEETIVKHIQFSHIPRFDPAIYNDLLGVEVEFSAPHSELQLAARQLFRPSPMANAALADAAFETARLPRQLMDAGRAFQGLAHLYCATQLPRSPVTIENMAACFGMTPRTLRRKLVESGKSFRSILDEVRHRYAMLYRQERTRSMSEIATLLGYSEVSAFSRSYKRMTGHAPSKQRGNATASNF